MPEAARVGGEVNGFVGEAEWRVRIVRGGRPADRDRWQYIRPAPPASSRERKKTRLGQDANRARLKRAWPRLSREYSDGIARTIRKPCGSQCVRAGDIARIFVENGTAIASAGLKPANEQKQASSIVGAEEP